MADGKNGAALPSQPESSNDPRQLGLEERRTLLLESLEKEPLPPYKPHRLIPVARSRYMSRFSSERWKESISHSALDEEEIEDDLDEEEEDFFSRFRQPDPKEDEEETMEEDKVKRLSGGQCSFKQKDLADKKEDMGDSERKGFSEEPAKASDDQETSDIQTFTEKQGTTDMEKAMEQVSSRKQEIKDKEELVKAFKQASPDKQIPSEKPGTIDKDETMEECEVQESSNGKGSTTEEPMDHEKKSAIEMEDLMGHDTPERQETLKNSIPMREKCEEMEVMETDEQKPSDKDSLGALKSPEISKEFDETEQGTKENVDPKEPEISGVEVQMQKPSVEVEPEKHEKSEEKIKKQEFSKKVELTDQGSSKNVDPTQPNTFYQEVQSKAYDKQASPDKQIPSDKPGTIDKEETMEECEVQESSNGKGSTKEEPMDHEKKNAIEMEDLMGHDTPERPETLKNSIPMREKCEEMEVMETDEQESSDKDLLGALKSPEISKEFDATEQGTKENVDPKEPEKSGVEVQMQKPSVEVEPEKHETSEEKIKKQEFSKKVELKDQGSSKNVDPTQPNTLDQEVQSKTDDLMEQDNFEASAPSLKLDPLEKSQSEKTGTLEQDISQKAETSDNLESLTPEVPMEEEPQQDDPKLVMHAYDLQSRLKQKEIQIIFNWSCFERKLNFPNLFKKYMSKNDNVKTKDDDDVFKKPAPPPPRRSSSSSSGSDKDSPKRPSSASSQRKTGSCSPEEKGSPKRIPSTGSKRKAGSSSPEGGDYVKPDEKKKRTQEH